MSTDPGSNSRSHGATQTYLRAQVNIGPLDVDGTSSAGDGNRTAMIEVQFSPSSPREGATEINQCSRLPAVPINNHSTTQQDISHNDTCTNDGGSNTDIVPQHTTEARVIRVREV